MKYLETVPFNHRFLSAKVQADRTNGSCFIGRGRHLARQENQKAVANNIHMNKIPSSTFSRNMMYLGTRHARSDEDAVGGIRSSCTLKHRHVFLPPSFRAQLDDELESGSPDNKRVRGGLDWGWGSRVNFRLLVPKCPVIEEVMFPRRYYY